MEASETGTAGLWRELRQRKVVRVGISYLVCGWVVIEVALTLFPEFGIPAWANRLVVLLVGLGLPVSLVLAWVFELTPDGLKVTDTARSRYGDTQNAPASQRRRNRLAVLVGGLFPAVLLGAVLGAGILWTLLDDQLPPAAVGPISELPVVAVLPFVNMSPDAENAFFADGVHEEILTKLAALKGLRVISRTSVMRYQGNAQSIAEIGAELGATHVVEGSVRRAGDSVRITAQLIDVASDQHLWAESFDRRLENAFEIQSRVAQNISRQLQAELSPAEVEALSAVGTRNAAAYDLYLQAQAIDRRIDGRRPDNLAAAIQALEGSVTLDSGYVDAWRLLVELQSWWVHEGVRFGSQGATSLDERRAEAAHALERVRSLAPDTAATRLAEAYLLYHGQQRYTEALATVEAGLAMAPGMVELIEIKGYLLRRLGRFDEALAALTEAQALDPLNANLLEQRADYLRMLERYDDSLTAYQQLAGLDPGNALAGRLLEAARLWANPDYDAWRALYEGKLADLRAGRGTRNDRFDVMVYLLQEARFEDADETLRIPRDDDLISDSAYRAAYTYHRTRALDFLGRTEDAQLLAEEALNRSLRWEAEEGEVMAPFQRQLVLLFKSYLYAYTGRNEAARASIARLAEELAMQGDALDRQRVGYWYVEAMTGVDLDEATRLALDPEQAIEVVTLQDFCEMTHLWYGLLKDARVRARFDGRPEWLTMLHRKWPDARAWPFPGEALSMASDQSAATVDGP